MNYRHAFHAGNFADVLKHAILALVLRQLMRKDTPFRMIDTHAGIGLYDLLASEAERTGEWRDGIGRVLDAPALRPTLKAFLEPYLEVVAATRALQGPMAYPGSPLIAQHLCRADDRMIFVEKHPEDSVHLEEAIGRDSRVKTIALDGWTALSAYVPPKERRGIVLVDPPFEEPGEFERLVKGLAKAYRKWPTGIYMLWYPIKNPEQTRWFMRALAETGIPKMLRVELTVRPESFGGPFAGSGLILVNPPWQLDEQVRAALPELRTLLSENPGSGWVCDWISPQ